MKLHAVGLVGVMLGAAMSVGCGSGLGHHGKWAQAPEGQVGSATLSSESIPLPASRMPLAQWEDDDDGATDPALQTWGAAPKPEDRYGF